MNVLGSRPSYPYSKKLDSPTDAKPGRGERTLNTWATATYFLKTLN